MIKIKPDPNIQYVTREYVKEDTMHCPTLSQLPKPAHGKRGWPWTEESAEIPDVMPSGDPWPKISIVTPSYNQAGFIEETIRSVLLQGYPNLEYIIIDGGSTDNSVEIIRKYEQWLTYWVSEPDQGQSQAINKGLSKATGEIYTWLNSDDYLLKNALRNISMAYHDSPGSGGWCGGALTVNVNGKILEVHWPRRLDVEGIANWAENMFWQPACFFSKDAWLTCGPLDEDLYYAMDFDLWLKIAKKSSLEKVNHVLAADRFHKNTKRQRDIGQGLAMQCVIQIRHGYERFAIEDIAKWVNEYWEFNRKFTRISRLPFLRPVLPFARIVWRKLL